jgi:hypothetical protein
MNKFNIGDVVQLKPMPQLYKNHTNNLKSNPDAILEYSVYSDLLNNRFKDLFNKKVKIVSIDNLSTEFFYTVSEFHEPIHENYFQLITITPPKW